METIRDRAIAYTAEPEYIVDFDNIYHCCNCEGYDDYCLAHAYADGAIEQKAIDDERIEELEEKVAEFSIKFPLRFRIELSKQKMELINNACKEFRNFLEKRVDNPSYQLDRSDFDNWVNDFRSRIEE